MQRPRHGADDHQQRPEQAQELGKRSGIKVDKSAVLRRNKIWVACQTDDDLPHVLKYAGDDKLVIGTDYGHGDTSSELNAIARFKAQHPNHVWSYDFVTTWTHGGRPLRLLCIIDEYTRDD